MGASKTDWAEWALQPASTPLHLPLRPGAQRKASLIPCSLQPTSITQNGWLGRIRGRMGRRGRRQPMGQSSSSAGARSIGLHYRTQYAAAPSTTASCTARRLWRRCARRGPRRSTASVERLCLRLRGRRSSAAMASIPPHSSSAAARAAATAASGANGLRCRRAAVRAQTAARIRGGSSAPPSASSTHARPANCRRPGAAARLAALSGEVPRPLSAADQGTRRRGAAAQRAGADRTAASGPPSGCAGTCGRQPGAAAP